ncbi:MAG: prepilin-type N-terminal cleavage/methylation domain-containing protein [Fusobacterium sp.]|nr:prepilin-type N-terminal cleavage/methylation domain-containing protein [Fusobacterium sp.]
MKNKGFSLIEVIVAIAIIGILSGIVGLKLRGHIAKSKDAKAVATLNSFRTASELYQLENSEALIASADVANQDKVKESLKKLEEYLDNKAKEIIKTNEIPIGGSRTSKDGDVKYGGKVCINFDNTGSISLKPLTDTGEFDIKGNKWAEY